MSEDDQVNPLDLTQVIEFVEFGDGSEQAHHYFADLIVEPDGSVVDRAHDYDPQVMSARRNNQEHDEGDGAAPPGGGLPAVPQFGRHANAGASIGSGRGDGQTSSHVALNEELMRASEVGNTGGNAVRSTGGTSQQRAANQRVANYGQDLSGDADDGSTIASIAPSVARSIGPVPNLGRQRIGGAQAGHGGATSGFPGGTGGPARRLPSQIKSSVAGGGMRGAPPFSSARGADDNALLFTAAHDVSDSEIIWTHGVIVPKTERLAGKEFRAYMEAATKPISPPLGVAKHFISTADGEDDEGNTTKSTCIQNAYAANIAKIELLEQRMVAYDLMRVFMVSTIKAGIDPNVETDPTCLWNNDGINMMRFWEKIDWITACYWQLTLNRRTPLGSDDRTSMEWAYLLIFNSCNLDLRAQIDIKYGGLPIQFQGCVTYMWVLFHCLFAASRDSTEALKKFFKNFSTKGLNNYKGESVVRAKTELMAAARRLDAIGQLEDNTAALVLKGFTKCSVARFRDHMKFKLQQMEGANIIPGGTRVWEHETAYEETSFVVFTGVEFYNVLNQANEWNIPKGHKFSAVTPAEKKCWNCGKTGCTPSTCSEPRNEERIKKNKKEYFDNKSRQNTQSGRSGSGRGGGRGGSSGRGRGGGRGDQGGRGQGGYSREKWGGPSTNSEIRWHNGEPHAYCKWCKRSNNGNKGGWNPTHNSKWHDAAMKDGFTVLQTLATLDPGHYLVAQVRSNQKGEQAPDLASASDISSNTGGMVGALTVTQGKNICDRFKSSAESDDTRNMVDKLQRALGLN